MHLWRFLNRNYIISFLAYILTICTFKISFTQLFFYFSIAADYFSSFLCIIMRDTQLVSRSNASATKKHYAICGFLYTLIFFCKNYESAFNLKRKILLIEWLLHFCFCYVIDQIKYKWRRKKMILLNKKFIIKINQLIDFFFNLQIYFYYN